MSDRAGSAHGAAGAAESPGRVTHPGGCGAAPALRPCRHSPEPPGSISPAQPSHRCRQGTSVPWEVSAELLSLLTPGRAGRAARAVRSPWQPPAIASEELTAPALGQPDTCPAPEERERRSQVVSPLQAARSSDPRAADQHARLVVELCCNPSQVTFVFCENPGGSARLFLVHGKGTIIVLTAAPFVFILFCEQPLVNHDTDVRVHF